MLSLVYATGIHTINYKPQSSCLCLILYVFYAYLRHILGYAYIQS